MAGKRAGDEWWRLERILVDHRNAALWCGVFLLAFAVFLFLRCQVLPITLVWGTSPTCPSLSVGAEMGVAIGTLSLAYSAFVSAAIADREGRRAREAIVRVWIRDYYETGQFVPPGTQPRIVQTSGDGITSVFVDNVGPGAAELEYSSAKWRVSTDRLGTLPNEAKLIIRQPYLAKNECALVRVPPALQEAIDKETDEAPIQQVVLEVIAHGFDTVPSPRAWLSLTRLNGTIESPPRLVNGRLVRRWEWSAENGGHLAEPSFQP